MELKLEVPWQTELLLVPRCEVTAAVIGHCGGPHVQIDGGDVIVRGFFGVDNKVPDVSRYRIGTVGACVLDDKYRISNDRYVIPHCALHEDISHCDIFGPALEQELQQRREVRNIVLLLESPHSEEYGESIMYPEAPARGRTGRNIDQYLGTVLSHVQGGFTEADCHVIISNPIQFQTSLYAIHEGSLSSWRTLRNNVWKTLWCEQSIRENFRRRLTRYNPCVIINACTGRRNYAGSLKRRVRTLVSEFFDESAQVAPCYYEITHPASWPRTSRTPTRIPLT